MNPDRISEDGPEFRFIACRTSNHRGLEEGLVVLSPFQRVACVKGPAVTKKWASAGGDRAPIAGRGAAEARFEALRTPFISPMQSAMCAYAG